MLASQSLELGWRQSLEDYQLPLDKRHYQIGNQLNVLSCIGRVKQSQMPRQTVLSTIDVVVITKFDLQCENTWITRRQWHTVIGDEAHEFLRGQKSGSTSLTLYNWYKLQACTRSMFLLSGTPYTTNIKFDVKRILQAIASEEIRARWGEEYTDEGISRLMEKWVDRASVRSLQSESAREQNEETAQNICLKLSLFTIRRDDKSKIRGMPVVRDYIGECERIDEPLVPADGGAEKRAREAIYQSRYHQPLRVSINYNERMRCLSYSYRYANWPTNGATRVWWSMYTLDEAKQHIRTRRLISILQEAKRTGNKVVVFVHRVFLLELTAKVSLVKEYHTNI